MLMRRTVTGESLRNHTAAAAAAAAAARTIKHVYLACICPRSPASQCRCPREADSSISGGRMMVGGYLHQLT